MSLVKSAPTEIRYDPQHALSNIFRVLPKEYAPMPSVKNPRPPRMRYWEKETEHAGTTIKFKGLLLLDVFDLHVLLALVMLAMVKRATVDGNTTTPIGRFLRNTMGNQTPDVPLNEDENRQQLLDLIEHAVDTSLPIASVATVSRYELTKLVTGDSSSQSYKRVKDSLQRLLHTTLDVKGADGSRYVSNMVSSVYTSADKKTISVAVNPVLTRSLRLDTGERYIKLYFDTFSSLSTVGKLLYTYLSARTWDGKGHDYTTETLYELVFPPIEGSPPVSRQTASKRVLSIVKAIQELGDLDGWKVIKGTSSRGKEKWTIQRTKTV